MVSSMSESRGYRTRKLPKSPPPHRRLGVVHGQGPPPGRLAGGGLRGWGRSGVGDLRGQSATTAASDHDGDGLGASAFLTDRWGGGDQTFGRRKGTWLD